MMSKMIDFSNTFQILTGTLILIGIFQICTVDLAMGKGGSKHRENSIKALSLKEKVWRQHLLNKRPIQFEVNNGQVDPQVKFFARGKGYTLFLTPDELVMTLKGSAHVSVKNNPDRVSKHDDSKNQEALPPTVIRMRLVNSNPAARIKGVEPLPGRSNYLKGNNPKKWQTGTQMYGKVKYTDIYPGIDLVYYSNKGELEYDFVVSPGADPQLIRLAFEGTDNLSLNKEGSLILDIPAGKIIQKAPFIYQKTRDVQHEVTGSYVLKEKDNVAFKVAGYDTTKPLIIDPILSSRGLMKPLIHYSTYMGASGYDGGMDIAVDNAGNTYITGISNSIDFPISDNIYKEGLNGPTGGQDAFVIKLDPMGGMVYATYFGGSFTEYVYGIDVDDAGTVYVTGATNSDDFPISENAFDKVRTYYDELSTDAFITKLDSSGMVVYSTYLGGANTEYGRGIAVDSLGNVYVTGSTASKSLTFPLLNAFQDTKDGFDIDAFVTKIDSNGTLIYSTFLGGGHNDIFWKGEDAGTDITVDAWGNAYITGYTESHDFPTQNALWDFQKGAAKDAFVSKLDSEGRLSFSTYLGGHHIDTGTGIALDESGNIYVTGKTYSTDFPITDRAFQKTKKGAHAPYDPYDYTPLKRDDCDAFVTKLDANGNLFYSTYLGGSLGDVSTGIAVDNSGNAYITGYTASDDFWLRAPFQWNLQGVDTFVTRLDTHGYIVYSSLLGGTDNDYAEGIAVDEFGNAYITGVTISETFPTINAYQGDPNDDNADAFVTRIDYRFVFPKLTYRKSIYQNFPLFGRRIR